MNVGQEIRSERLRRGWTLDDLAKRGGVSIGRIHDIEAGNPSSVEGYVRLALALGLEPRLTVRNERVARTARDVDPVHSAMGEVEAAHLRSLGFEVLIDEPYQHYQFSGRADLLAISRERRALLHLENRTRFPDIQDAIGSFNGKRAYIGPELAARIGIAGGFRTEIHVIVGLWSAEVLHSLRLRRETFTSVGPDPADRFGAWWAGTIDLLKPGKTSSIVVLDPLPGRRSSRRRWIGLEAAMTADPRYRGYADVADALHRAGVA